MIAIICHNHDNVEMTSGGSIITQVTIIMILVITKIVYIMMIMIKTMKMMMVVLGLVLRIITLILSTTFYTFALLQFGQIKCAENHGNCPGVFLNFVGVLFLCFRYSQTTTATILIKKRQENRGQPSS